MKTYRVTLTHFSPRWAGVHEFRVSQYGDSEFAAHASEFGSGKSRETAFAAIEHLAADNGARVVKIEESRPVNREFPDYDNLTLFDWIASQIDAIDASWRNNAAPSLSSRDHRVNLWVDYRNPNLREHGDGYPTLIVWSEDAEEFETESPRAAIAEFNRRKES